MAQQTINLGAAPDDGTGDTLRVGGDKINDNFTELYTDYLPKAGGTLTGDLVVPDEAYDATAWNGSLEVPTKNAVRDKIESLGASGLEIEDEGVSEATGVIKLNFVGSGVAAVDQGGGEVEVTIPGGISTFALGDATDVDTTAAAAGEALIYDGTGWVAAGGSSFPGSPATGHRFYRTDRNIEYFYDGTRWLSTQLFTAGHWTSALAATATFYVAIPFTDVYDIYLEYVQTQSQLTNATTASNYFSMQWASVTATVVVTNIGSAQSTQSDTQNNIVVRNQVIGAVVDMTASAKGIACVATETGTATMNAAFSLAYRLVG